MERQSIGLFKEEERMEVEARKNENPHSLIRRFSKKIKDSGILEEYKERMYFVKPSDKKRKEKRLREKRLKKLQENSNG